jgi:aryl-alcohol dehydrogenase-like predicted oxidoreductase
VNNVGQSRKHIIEGVNGCLQRLGLEYLDLIYAHRPDRNTPIEETVRAYNHVINTGKAFYWGTSEWNADEIAQAWRVADRLGLIGPVMEQPQYNMLVREKVEREFWGLYREHGLGLTIFSPLKGGILTGKYNEGIPKDSRYSTSEDPVVKGFVKNVGNEDWQKQIETVRKLKAITEKLNTSYVILALAWVLKNKNVSSAITGASKPEQIYESVKALELQEKLTPEVMQEIEEILANKPQELTLRFG